MSQYEHLAGRYDALTRDVDYVAFADYIEWQFSRRPEGVKLALDLCCGTGSLTQLLAARGYDMIGVDASADMLALAANKEFAGEAPLFLCQSIERLNLYGSVDACVSTLDSINYITQPKKLQQGFARVHLFLEPGGLFLFDINRPETLAAMDGEVFLDETEDTYCVWRGSMERGVLTFDMDIFRQSGNHWNRYYEQHRQRAYQIDELSEMLKTAGFSKIELFGNCSKKRYTDSDTRIFFAAWKD